MHAREPSLTAYGAARHRAVHQVLESGSVFTDPLALSILGESAEAILCNKEQYAASCRLRLFIALRTRFAEDALAAAVAGGVSQLVVLGAGFDTFAYRTTLGARLRIFEVDHPATQAFKRQRLAAASIAVPPWLTFAPVDFECDTLAAGLAAARFDREQPSFFTWLGVVPYLSEDAVYSTLAVIGSLRRANVVFDYANPVTERTDTAEHQSHAELAARVNAAGEPFQSYFVTSELPAKLTALGLPQVEDFSPREIAERYFPSRPARSATSGARIVHAKNG
jgi:methyltransferase (TIGR00027 family)